MACMMQRAAQLVEQLGDPLELDTDGSNNKSFSFAALLCACLLSAVVHCSIHVLW